MASEVDKCYLCDLLGDFEEFKDIKQQFDAQHECWKQNKSKNDKEELNINKNNSQDVIIHKIQNSKIFSNNISQPSIKQCKVILHDFKESKCGKRQCFLKTLKRQDKFWIRLNSSRIFGPFSCNRCPNSLTSKYLLKRHISEVHKASKRNRSSEAMDPQSGQHNVKQSFRNKYGTSGITLDIASSLYRCNHCSFVSGTRYDGQKHVTKKHGAKILFSCDHCDQKYMDKCALKIHMDSVIKGEGGKYRCNFCEFKACKEYGLWKHKESEHKIGTKRGKKCNLCGKVFSHLKRHIMTVHERRKDLKCEKCGKSFDQNYNLRQHQKKCH